MTDPWQEAERAKYERVWADRNRAYAKQADGDPVVDRAFEEMGCKKGESLIDWGCGCGRPAAKFQAKGLDVVGFDIAANCLDADVKIPFLQRCLWDLPEDGVSSDYAFSTDVLEHIPPEHLPKVLSNIHKRTRKAAFLQVCTRLDRYGPSMDPPMRLHLAVYPHETWAAMLYSYWRTGIEYPNIGKARSAFLCFKE